jgi:hypothetical protein
MVKTLEGGRQKTSGHKNHGAIVASFVCFECVSPPLKVSIVTMGFTAGLIGAATGFSVQMFSNATRKVPLSRGKRPMCRQYVLRFHIPFDSPWFHNIL